MAGTIQAVMEKQPLLFVLGVMIALDISTGLGAAFVEKKLSSKISFVGMVRKTMMLMLIAMAAAFERVQPDVPLIKLVSLFFIFVEGLSIIENCKRAGVPVPVFLANAVNNLEKGSGIVKDTHVEMKGVDVLLDVQTKVAPPDRDGKLP